MLTPAQTEWTRKECNNLCMKYLSKWPLKDSDWEDLKNEAADIAKKAKNNKEVMEALVRVIMYLESKWREERRFTRGF